MLPRSIFFLVKVAYTDTNFKGHYEPRLGYNQRRRGHVAGICIYVRILINPLSGSGANFAKKKLGISKYT